MADTGDLKSPDLISRAGSSPAARTNLMLYYPIGNKEVIASVERLSTKPIAEFHKWYTSMFGKLRSGYIEEDRFALWIKICTEEYALTLITAQYGQDLTGV